MFPIKDSFSNMRLASYIRIIFPRFARKALGASFVIIPGFPIKSGMTDASLVELFGTQ